MTKYDHPGQNWKSWLYALPCSKCLRRGLSIGAFTLFLVIVLGMMEGGSVDGPTSPDVFVLLSLGFMVFVIGAPALIEKAVTPKSEN